MRTDAQPPTGGIYRPRNPWVSPLYQCVRRHSNELDAAGLVHRPVEAEVLERFLDCGDLHKVFARVYCDQCGHDYLLAHSCKTRYFCPSCHQERMLAYAEWLEDNVLAPVPHRQYVFALPKLVRPFFRLRRRYLGELCRLVAALLNASFSVHNRIGSEAADAKGRRGRLPIQIACEAEAQLPADAGSEVAAAAHEPHPRHVLTSRSLLRLLLQPLAGREKARREW